MKKNILILVSLLMIFAFSACEDLEVTDINQPTDAQVNSPEQAPAIVAGLFNSWYMTAVDYDGPGLGLWTMADVGSCSWGNAGMRDLSSQPRTNFNNTPSYSNMIISENYYKGMYTVVNTANTAMNALDPEGANYNVSMAGAYLMYGTALGSIGLLYDQGFIITTETDFAQEIPLVPYTDIIDAAVAALDEAIAICDANTFDVPGGWFPSEATLTNEELGKIANTMAARLLTYKSRNAAQNDLNDWGTIRDYALNGIDFDWEIVMDDITWYNLLATYSVYTGWGRVDMRVINMMDPNMEPWFPASGKVEELTNSGLATSDDERLESDFQYLAKQDFNPERGYYHFTTYRYARYDTYLSTWTEPLAYIRKAENDMILAEAYTMLGDYDLAAAILNDENNSRKDRGGLGDVAEDKDELLAAILYEKTIECMLTGENVEFYDMRRRGLLQAGSFTQLPIPAQQLEVLQMDFYTFGGNIGEAGVDYSEGGWETLPGYEMPVY